jgi:hypothetical protein
MFPFGYGLHEAEHTDPKTGKKKASGPWLFCQKCGMALWPHNDVPRILCHGSWFKRQLRSLDCPKGTDHFHLKCHRCGYQWTEMTRNVTNGDVLEDLVRVAKKLDLTEEQLVEAWRTGTVRDVMEQ